MPAHRITIGTDALFPIPRFQWMQFMEPLGTTDGSVEAAWDHGRQDWRADVVAATAELAPTMIRWGGCFSSFYRWREAVGPRAQRTPMHNLLWGGIESNQVGTAEFVDFCRRVAAEPLLSVNFEADGRQGWAHPPGGGERCAGPAEAAAWVAYCNDPANRERQAHGAAAPHRVTWWQIGNETSYDKNGFDLETSARKTVEFARAMRAADPSIKLIGWGDRGVDESAWAPRMLEVAGEHLDAIAYHLMWDPCPGPASPLRDLAYREDPARTWEHFMEAYRVPERRLAAMRAQIAGSGKKLALTECHFALPGRNRCEALSTWAAGVADARVLNLHLRNGDQLEIATLADFCGTRWQVNALMIPTPGGRPFLMPVAKVMALYRHHVGEQAVQVDGPTALDIVASRSADRFFLHVVNTERSRPVTVDLAIAGRRITGGRVFQLAADPMFEVWEHRDDILQPQRFELPASGAWTFPAASVSAVEIDVTPAEEATRPRCS